MQAEGGGGEPGGFDGSFSQGGYIGPDPAYLGGGKKPLPYDSVSNIFRDGRLLDETVAALRADPGLAERVDAILVFFRDGSRYPLDNRRLLAPRSLVLKSKRDKHQPQKSQANYGK